MPWPTQVWDPQNPLADDTGMVPFQMQEPGEAYLSGIGLTGAEFGARPDLNAPGLNVWDAMESPFFKGMYEMGGGDWDQLKADFADEIGTYEEQTFRIKIGEEVESGRRPQHGQVRHGEYVTVPSRSPIYKTFDGYQAALDWINSNPEDEYGREYDFNESHIELAAQSEAPQYERSMGGIGPLRPVEPETHIDEDDYRFWGINNDKWEGIFNKMAKDGMGVVKKYELQAAPIIAEGPKASDYGIVTPGNNIFAYYGLDRPPEGPKELEWNSYNWNLKQTWTSNVSYAVPPGLKRADLHGDTPSWQPRASLQDEPPTAPA